MAISGTTPANKQESARHPVAPDPPDLSHLIGIEPLGIECIGENPVSANTLAWLQQVDVGRSQCALGIEVLVLGIQQIQRVRWLRSN